ncbi:MAG: DNA repair protein RecN [Rickettsiales bacterium]|nr:DNA repair protein RecN [Rickettsiales bacterium]
MLNFLSIENIVLIKKTNIDFGSGFNVLSGETGSGKSILLDSLGLAIGFRSNIRLIKQGEKQAKVIAEFDISQNKICQDFLSQNDLENLENKHSLTIRRSIQETSQKTIANKIFVNDHPIGVGLLSNIGELLVEIHGQHDQRGLLDEKSHIKILDEFAKNDIPLKNLEQTYLELREVEKKLREITEKRESNEKEKDYLEHVILELEKADIKENEEKELVEKKDQFISKEKISNFLNDFNNNINEANLALVNAQKQVIRNSNIIENYLHDQDLDLEKISEKIDEHTISLDEIIKKVEDKISDLNNLEGNEDDINERLLEIRSLARKFNVVPDELKNVIEKSKDNLDKIDNEFSQEKGLAIELDNLKKKYFEIANFISIKRVEASKILSQKVEDELQFLKMPDAKFLVKIEERTDEENKKISIDGFDKVRFLASLNKNNFDNIAKIASGGELSRFMLALKVALMDTRSTPTIIFDEIDTGIGGNTANAVGERLKTLSKNLQILVVTHQAQIAAKSDHHFKVSKTSNDKESKTLIEKLDKNKKETEIARMLSGEEITIEALAAAKKLIE